MGKIERIRQLVLEVTEDAICRVRTAYIEMQKIWICRKK